VRAVVQRVSRAEVRVDGAVVGSIRRGFLVLLGVTHSDSRAEAEWLARKIVGLRVFEDSAGKMNLALSDVGGAVLLVSQFTLYGDARRGRRPSFTEAARPEQAEPLVEYCAGQIQAQGIEVSTGRFGAHMEVELINEGPVTLWLDTAALMAEAAAA
jgi:D-aminoacyl-tRNA deacylase